LYICNAQKVPSVTLNNGEQMPMLAFAANIWQPSVCETATTEAINAGFRFIWSSALIGASCQEAQARAITNSEFRDELFIAGTINSRGCSSNDDCYTKTMSGAEEQYARLGQSHLDMLMLDYPTFTCDGNIGQWRALEKLLADGRVGTIALSNFDTTQLQCLLDSDQTSVVPAVNQMMFHVGKSTQVVPDNAQFGINVQAYSPLGAGSLIGNPTLEAIGEAHGKTSAQVALRWIIQHRVAIATQSTNSVHLKEDVAVFDFSLTHAEMQQLDALVL